MKLINRYNTNLILLKQQPPKRDVVAIPYQNSRSPGLQTLGIEQI